MIGTIESAQASLLIIGAIAQTMFVLMYGMRPWWRHYIGRALFIKGTALALLLDSQLYGYLWPYPQMALVNTVVDGIVTASVVWQLFAFIKQITSADARKARAYERNNR